MKDRSGQFAALLFAIASLAVGFSVSRYIYSPDDEMFLRIVKAEWLDAAYYGGVAIVAGEDHCRLITDPEFGGADDDGRRYGVCRAQTPGGEVTLLVTMAGTGKTVYTERDGAW